MLITPKTRQFHVNASPLPGLVRETKEDGERRILRFYARHGAAGCARAGDAAAGRDPRARPRLDLQDLGRGRRLVLGPRARAVRRGRRGAQAGARDHEGPHRRSRPRSARSTSTRRETPLRGARSSASRDPARASCAQTLARGWGDCKDKATRHRHDAARDRHPATMVLVRTGMRGGIERRAREPRARSITPSRYVPSLDLYLDGTAEHTGSTELPAMDRGALALQINRGQAEAGAPAAAAAGEASVTRRKIDVGARARRARRQFTLDLTGDRRLRPDLPPALPGRGPAPRARAARSRRRAGRVRAGRGQGRAGADRSRGRGAARPPQGQGQGARLRAARRRDAGDPARPDVQAHGRLRLALEAQPRRRPARPHAEGRRVDHQAAPGHEGHPLPAAADAVSSTRHPVATRSRSRRARASSSCARTLAFKKARITPAEYPAWRAFCEAVDRNFGQSIEVSK